MKLTKDEISRRRRRVAQMHLQGMEVDEIGKELGISRRSVWRHLAKARETWKKERLARLESLRDEATHGLRRLERFGWEALEKSDAPGVVEKTSREIRGGQSSGGEAAAGSVRTKAERITRTQRADARLIQEVRECIESKLRIWGLNKATSADWEEMIQDGASTREVIDELSKDPLYLEFCRQQVVDQAEAKSARDAAQRAEAEAQEAVQRAQRLRQRNETLGIG